MTTQQNKRNKLVKEDLAQFRGTEQYWRTGVPWHPFLFTDGVHHVVQHGEAVWLLDVIGSWQTDKRLKDDRMLGEFQHWVFAVNSNGSCDVRCERDSRNVAVSQHISFTDFPLPEIRFYLTHMRSYWNYKSEHGDRKVRDFGVLMLPSEY